MQSTLLSAPLPGPDIEQYQYQYVEGLNEIAENRSLGLEVYKLFDES